MHFPLQAPEATIRKYGTGNPKRDILLAMLEHEDLAVGKVLDALKSHGLEKDTLVVFFSDNGRARANASNKGALRDFKGSAYEGGIRVPFLMSWPGTIPEKSVFREPVICMDVLPTAAAAAGAPLPARKEIHGKNLLPYLTGKAAGRFHEWLFWDGGEERSAVRHGRWKLVNQRGTIELFDLEADVGEKRDLSAETPDVRQRLQGALEVWQQANAPRTRGGRAASENDDGGDAEAKRDRILERQQRKQERGELR